MAIDVETLAVAKGYTDKAIEGVGTIKGKNCTIKDISPITGGNRVTFNWETDSGVSEEDYMDVMNGQDGQPGTNGRDGVDGKDGQDGAKGKDGTDGVGISSITFKEVDQSGNNVYTITLSNGDHSDIVCPKGPQGSTGQTGIGVPAGGTEGQVLKKKSGTDFDTEWGTGGGEVDLGYGHFICNTGNLSAGDKIRVRAVYDVTKHEEKIVTTPGIPVVFDDIEPYDYYKVCLLQEVEEGGQTVEIEVGGSNYTVDFGQTYFVDVLDKTTLGGAQGILNAHQESSQFAIGDEVPITVNGNPWIMQIAGINVYHDHDIMFTSKHIWTTGAAANYKYSVSDARTQSQLFYSEIDSKDKQFIKQVTRTCREDNGTMVNYDDYCFVLGNKETFNNTGYGTVPSQVQMPLFVTQANRVKTYNGTANSYWVSDNYNTAQGVNYIGSDGNNYVTGGAYLGVVPSFMLIADS